MPDAGYSATGTGEILEQGAQTPLKDQPGFLKDVVGGMYKHPFRWAAWEYKYNLKLRPGAMLGSGAKWTGLMGWKALGRGQLKPWSTDSQAFFMSRNLPGAGAGRAITGGMVGSIGKLISSGATAGSTRAAAGAAFGQGGLYGLGEFLGTKGHVTSGAGLKIAGGLFGGAESNIGKFGYDFIGNKIEDLGATNLLKAGDILKKNKPGWFASDSRRAKISEKMVSTMVRQGAKKEAAQTAVASFTSMTRFARWGNAAMNLWAAASIATAVAKTAHRIADYGVTQLGAILRNAPGLETGGVMPSYLATQGAVTERQRALQAISSSRMNARSALGGEAGLAHRSYVGGTYI